MTICQREGAGLAPAVAGGPCRLVGGVKPAANDQPPPLQFGETLVFVAARKARVKHELASGQKLTVTVPLDWYTGVAVDVVLTDACEVAEMRLVLAHADPALEVTLASGLDEAEVVAEWRSWANRLGLPMLTRMAEGDQPAAPHIGRLPIGTPAPRRAPRAFLKRRPTMLRRRKVGVAAVRPAKSAV